MTWWGWLIIAILGAALIGVLGMVLWFIRGLWNLWS